MSGSVVTADRSLCIGSGLCADVAPDVFGAAEDDLVEILVVDPDPQRDDVARAITGCPIGALSWARPTKEQQT